MKTDSLRMTVGFSIISSHLLSFAIILIGAESMTIGEKTELSLLISPVFAIYVTAIVRRFTAFDATFDATPTHPALWILSIGTSSVFAVAIPTIIFAFVIGKITNFAALKATVGIVETALGLYTGAIVDRLFGGGGGSRKRRRP